MTALAPRPARSRPILAALRLSRLVVSSLTYGTIVRTPWRWLSEEQRHRLTNVYTPRWAQSSLDAFGIPVRATGPKPPKGALLVPNHITYLDIIVLASQVPCLFLSKAEIAGWPLIGGLLRNSSHLFFSREDRGALRAVIDAVRAKLERGERVCVFLEGTTNGDGILPFRSSFLAAAIAADAPVVPVGIRYETPPRVDFEEDIAYWKDHVFGPHAWRLLGLNGVRAEVRFGKARRLPRARRRQSAEELREEVARLVDG